MMCGNAPLFSSGKHQELGIHPFIQSLPGPKCFSLEILVMSDMSLGISWSSMDFHDSLLLHMDSLHKCWRAEVSPYPSPSSPRLSTIAQAKKKNKATHASHANRQFQRWREDDYIEKNMAARSCHGCLEFRGYMFKKHDCFKNDIMYMVYVRICA